MKFSFTSTKIALIISIAFIFAMEFVPALQQNVLYYLLGTFILLLGVFWKQSDDRTLIAALLIVFSASTLLFNKEVDQITLTIRTASIAAFVLLNIVLLIGPWSRFSKRIRSAYYFRRHLGVTTFLLAWLHFSLVFSYYFSFDLMKALSLGFTFYGFIAFSILMWMALTSWDTLQKKVPREWWNYLYTVLFLMFLWQAYNFYISQKAINNTLLPVHLTIVSVFALFWILAAPYGIIKRIMATKVYGWKQVHVLIHLAYWSTIIHVFFSGQLSKAPQWLSTPFWVLIAFTLGSHAYGWINRIREDKAISARINRINSTITENGIEYLGVGKVEEFIEGKGQKFYISKLPVAVFKYGDKFVALSNVCAHQKGPLCDGKIQNGYIVCPWHQWEYSVEDGRGPPGHKDAVPYYETKVKEGIVYIALRPGKIRTPAPQTSEQ